MTPLAPRIIPIVRFAVRAWFTPLGLTGGVHWQQSGEGDSPPLILCQLTGPGTEIPSLGAVDWAGELLVRALAPKLLPAETVAAQAAALVPKRYEPPDDPLFVLSAAVSAKPFAGPPGAVNAQAGFFVRLTLTRR